MRLLFRPPALCLLLYFAAATSSPAQVRTDAESDGFAGPVKSVSTFTVRSDARWQQPGGPTMVTPIWCSDCQYDPDGAKTMSGQISAGKFYGEIIRLVRDANGHVTDRYSTSASTGETLRHDVMGPFGRLEETTYLKSKVQFRQTFVYDQYGHVTEWRTVNGQGKLESRTSTTTTKDGTVTDRSVRSKDGELQWQQTFDPETEVERFTTFDSLGRLKLMWIVDHGKLVSFWEAPDSPSQFGDNFSEPSGDGNSDNYACHSDGSCDRSRVHYEYLNGNKHNPLSSEWRDADGNLRLAAYFEYAIDSFGNWTNRTVWVWNADVGERALYETDARAISYWPK